MTAHRDAPDPVVFGPHRGGVFMNVLGEAVPTDPAWCSACDSHRVEKPGQKCPMCREDT